jgi:hypothetical protein
MQNKMMTNSQKQDIEQLLNNRRVDDIQWIPPTVVGVPLVIFCSLYAHREYTDANASIITSAGPSLKRTCYASPKRSWWISAEGTKSLSYTHCGMD